MDNRNMITKTETITMKTEEYRKPEEKSVTIMHNQCEIVPFLSTMNQCYKR